ncbi:MAG: DUF3108 domain-containing protein [Kiritimatiellae bacterium]|nr:DUF3108 domain-containing protein [Kiritimatiellia bacterium]
MRKSSIVRAVSLAGALSLGTALAEPARALADGETFTYALYLKHGFVTVKAGMAQLDVKERDGAYEATMTLKALPVVDMIYHLYARMTTRLTPELKPLRYEKHAEEGGCVYDEVSSFSYPQEGGCRITSKQTYKDGTVKERETQRPGEVFDLLSLIFHARRLDVSSLTPGARLDVAVVSGVTVKNQSLEYKGVEEVETDDGTKAKVGIFSLSSDEDGGVTARFAFSQEGKRVIQRIDILHKYGSLSARLRPSPNPEK